MKNPLYTYILQRLHIDGLVQDCSNSIANALELLQSCTKPLIRLCLEHHDANGCPPGDKQATNL